mmetsp:Transcript_31837/g.59473  ORF Transcript_31837/g.59473 Transcript_31837/m.59473 type:complete len:123 (+) Transcript_31837:1522-1890(+)
MTESLSFCAFLGADEIPKPVKAPFKMPPDGVAVGAPTMDLPKPPGGGALTGPGGGALIAGGIGSAAGWGGGGPDENLETGGAGACAGALGAEAALWTLGKSFVKNRTSCTALSVRSPTSGGG